MPSLFPEIEPYDQGMMDVGEGHEIYWEVCGNPRGKPAVVLHGGPGSGCTPRHRRYFDPSLYRVVLFDQRSSGRSTPHASAVTTDLTHNTTAHLLRDIEQLRESLGIESWLVWGFSWGVTLGLLYAQSYPERVSEAVFGSITMTRPIDIHWLYHEAGRFVPEAWSRFRDGALVDERDVNLVDAYYQLLNESSDVSVRERAAQQWCEWEDAVLSLEPGWAPSSRYENPDFRMSFARIVTHYFHHGAWLDDDEILLNADRLRAIPGVLVHGQLDIGGPVDVAWLLSKVWPNARLHVVHTGHGGGDEMTSQLVEATNGFAQMR
ncbi:MAG: prolyl aminopeptidase [Acidimicrobiales bacterium]